MVELALAAARDFAGLQPGERVVLTAGRRTGTPGATNLVMVREILSVLSPRTERSAPRRGFLVVSAAKRRSTRYTLELEIGAQFSVKRGCASSQRRIAGFLGEAVVERHGNVDRRDPPSMRCRNFLNRTRDGGRVARR